MAYGAAQTLRGIAAVLLVAVLPALAWAVKYDDLALDRWAKLGEADRYQLNIAEKYYRELNWKAAISEYEKFLTLYEKSEDALRPTRVEHLPGQPAQVEFGHQRRLSVGHRLLARLE